MSKDFLKKLDRRLNQIADEQAHKVGVDLKEIAQELTPKDSGDLASSIHMSARKREHSVSIWVDYAQARAKSNSRRKKSSSFNYGKWIFEGRPYGTLNANKKSYMTFKVYRNGHWVRVKQVKRPIRYNIFKQAIKIEKSRRNGGK